MGGSRRKQEFGLTARHGRLGSLGRLARELLPLRRQTLRTSVNGSVHPASDRDRRAAAVVKTNAEMYRDQAYQAYLRRQVR